MSYWSSFNGAGAGLVLLNSPPSTIEIKSDLVFYLERCPFLRIMLCEVKGSQLKNNIRGKYSSFRNALSQFVIFSHTNCPGDFTSL